MHDLYNQHNLLHERGYIVVSIRQYILSVLCVVIVAGLSQTLFAKGTMHDLIKWIGGLAVTVTVLNPIVKGDLFQWDIVFSDLRTNKEIAVEEGLQIGQEALAARISTSTCAYILNEVSDLGADVEVELDLQENYPYQPEQVRICGAVSPYIKQQLSSLLERELGITEDHQIWVS